MEMLIAVVTIALIGLVGYAIYTDPPSSGCLSVDAARARDEKLQQQAMRKPAVVPDPAVPEKPEALTAAVPAEASPEHPGQSPLLRNPLTGETAPVPNNYRFAKRWIKQAMVEEGLLDKVYGNTDLDEPNAAKVKAALMQFKDLPKYRA
ncbi:hypothetical protein ACW73L_04225 [Methylolobus aquaticus]